ncbi:PAS domain S-box protein, partial [Candidatus Bathyarchaeota archaeon]|nr:PAS domain S-box protein [Candidatus Bathyarchaeota archaeon]
MKVAKQCLKMQGEIDVDTVSSVNEASEKLKKTDYDAVVCDYQTPGKDGLEFLKELRAGGNTIPFIIFTGKGKEEIAIKALNLGADQYIDKHGDPETVYYELAHAIRQAVGRRSAQIELLKREAKLHAILESSPEAITITDLEGNVVECNQAAVEMHGGQSRKDLMGKNALGLIAEKDREKAIQNLKKTIEQGSVKNVEYALVTGDGREFSAELSASVVRGASGKPEYLVAITRDITERKKAEEKIRDSEERLSVLFELAPDAYYLNDLKGNFVDGNKAAEEVTGYMKDELIGKSFLKLKLLPRSQALKAAKLLAMNALGKPTGPDEFVLNRKDGTQIPVEIRTYPVRIKGKTLVLGIARDVTIRKKSEQAVRESQQKFEGLFRHNPEAAVYLGPDFCIQGINPRFEKLFGYALPEIKGKHIDDVVVPNDKREEAQALDSQAIQGYAHQNTWRRRKNGSPVPVSISAAPIIIEDRLAGYIGIYSDISELRSTQKKLEAMNEKLRVVGG